MESGNIAGQLNNVNNFNKTGGGDLTVASGFDVKGDLNVQSGDLILSRPATVGGALKVDGTLSLNIQSGGPALIADTVDLSNGTLNISGFSGNAVTDFYIVIQSQQEIEDADMPQNYTIGKSPEVDYLSAQLRRNAELTAIEAAIGLTWYDEHTNSSNEYDQAHGTFTIDTDGDFTLGSILKDRNGEFKDDAWDGKTLTKKGEGVLTLTAENEHTGGIIVEGGAYTGVTNIQNGTLAVNGDLTMAAGSIYHLELDRGTNTNDLIKVNGTAKIGGAVLDHIGLNNGINPLGRWTILEAHTLEGEFAEINSIYQFLNIVASYEDNKVILDITRGATYSSEGYTKNQRSTGAALDSLTDGPLFNHLLTLPNTVNFPNLYDLLSGEIYASVAGHVINYDRAFGQALIRRGNDRRPDGQPLWVSFDGYYTETDGTHNTGKATIKGGGISLGTEAWVTDKFMLGFAFRYSDNDLEIKSRDAKADIESYNVGIYAGTDIGRLGDGKLRFTFGRTYGYHNVDASRSVNTLGQNLKADYDVHSAQFFAELGCRFKLNENLTLEPYGGVAWNTVWTEAFKEKGGYAALKSADKNNSNFSTNLGVRAQAAVTEEINVKADVSWKHTYGDIDPSARFAFAGSDKFTIEGAPLSRDALNVNLGAQLNLSENTSIEGGYTGELGDRHQSHGGFLKLNITF